MLPAPPGAQCAIHPGAPASGLCDRCGNFMCNECSADGAQSRCPTCREKEAVPEFPFDESASFTELFNHVVEQFKRDPSMPVIGTVVYFGIVMLGSVVGNVFTQVINTILGANLNDPEAIKSNPMLIFQALAVSYAVSVVIQTLTQALALSALYRMLFDVVNGRKGDVARMFGHLKDLPKYIALQVTVFAINFIVPMGVLGITATVMLKMIGFDWSDPAHTKFERLVEPGPLGIFLGAMLVIIVFSLVMLPISIFAMPEMVVGKCTPTEAIARAFQLGSGQRLRIFGYAFVIGLMMVAGVLACCIGVLVTFPTAYMLWASLFLALRKKSGLPPADFT